MYIPIEMKRSMKYGSNYWEVYSPKIGRKVKFFSDLEYDNWLHIETNPNIISFCEQPLKIRVYDNQKFKESIFDMWVLYKDNTEEFMEIKYQSELKGLSKRSNRSINQIKIQKKWCLENNYKYSVITDKEIRKDPIYLNNLKQIISQVRDLSNIRESDITKITDCLLNEQRSIRYLVEKTGLSNSYIIQIVCKLIYTGICKLVNPYIEINLESEVNLIV